MNIRIAIAIEDNSKGRETVAEHFGRCSKFKVCELDEENSLVKTEIFFNPLVGEHNGACQLPAYIKHFNVQTIIAGGMGQKAVNNFLNFGINIITAPGLAFDDAFNRYINGELKGYETCKHGHNH